MRQLHTPPSFQMMLTIEGMMCQNSCGSTVKRALEGVKGVISAEVSYPKKRAIVTGSAILEDLIEAVDAVGFDASAYDDSLDEQDGLRDTVSIEAKPDHQLFISNMSDSFADPSKIKDIIYSVDGVLDVNVIFNMKMANVYGFVDFDSVSTALQRGGYEVTIYDASRETLSSPQPKLSLSLSSSSSSSSSEVFTPPSSSSSSSSPSSLTVDKNLEFVLLVLKVFGMSCASCVRKLEDTLMTVRGVRVARVALLTQKVEVVAVDTGCKVKDVCDAILKLGFTLNILAISLVGSEPYSIMKFRIIRCKNPKLVGDIQSRLENVDGIIRSDISLDSKIVRIKTTPDFGINLDMTEHDGQDILNGPRDVLDFLATMGLDCDLFDHEEVGGINGSNEESDLTSWKRLLFVALLFGIPITVLHSLQIYSSKVRQYTDSPMYDDNHVTMGQAIMLLLNFPMQFFVGYKYYYSAYFGALQGNFGMDCLVVTGTSITFFYSLVQIGFAYATGIRAKHVFFEASGMLLMFVTLGKYLEAYAKGKTMSSISSLLKLQPKKALLVESGFTTPINSPDPKNDSLYNNNNRDEKIREIDLRLVQRGDVLKILPGSRIPTDGYVISGSTYVDESMITGESLPVSRGLNDFVFGSTVNQSGLIYSCASSVGDDSAIAQIAKLVESAQMTKAPIQAYADRVAAIFTPTIILLSISVFIIWSYLAMQHQIPRWWYEDEFGSPLLFAMLFAISVVVISCPCALGLATPTAIMVGTSVAASNGILIKGGPAFEEAHKVTAIIFDKTGTLTEGKPIVTDEIVMSSGRRNSSNGNNPNSRANSFSLVKSEEAKRNLLRLAAIVEQGSDHPIASAILMAAETKKIVYPKLEENSFQLFPGNGISCECEEGTIVVGNRIFMDQSGVVTGQRVDAAMWDLEVQGKTAICVALDKELIGILGIADKCKSDSSETLRALFALGIDIWMVTGDNQTTAYAIADELDIPRERVIAGAMPADKLSKVDELQESGFVVAMIGDGINDSPALAKANLGIAIGAGSQVAVESADLVLVKSNLFDIVVALDLSKKVFSKIKWNLMWALLYNVIAIPFAAGALFPYTHTIIPPQYAGLSMAFSSVLVVCSSLSLKFYQKPAVSSSVNGASTYTIEVATSSHSSTSSLQSLSNVDSGGIFDSAKRNISRLRDLLKSRMKASSSSADYAKLAMEDIDENNTLGLELGLGSVRVNRGENSFDELNKLIM